MGVMFDVSVVLSVRGEARVDETRLRKHVAFNRPPGHASALLHTRDDGGCG